MKTESRDFQRSRIYAFEHLNFPDAWNEENRLSRAECRSLFRRALKRYGIDPQARMMFGQGFLYRIEFKARGNGGGEAFACVIHLNGASALNAMTVLHETAHIIARQYSPLMGHEMHGEYFAAILGDLYQRYLGIRAWKRSMQSFGIKIAPRDAIKARQRVRCDHLKRKRHKP